LKELLSRRERPRGGSEHPYKQPYNFPYKEPYKIYASFNPPINHSDSVKSRVSLKDNRTDEEYATTAGLNR